MANKPSIMAQLHPNPKLEKYRNEVLTWKTKVEEAEVKVEQSEHSLTLEENRIETKFVFSLKDTTLKIREKRF